jgi:hypothetical protein
MKTNIFSSLLIVTTVIFASDQALAQPVAIVEDAQGEGVPVQIMELLEEGAVIELPKGTSIVLGYLGSCLREHIAGGKATVGADQSEVTGGEVTRETIQCQSASASPTSQSGEAGALIFRGGPESPDFPPKISDINPAFLLDGVTEGTLIIERIDREEAVRELAGPGPLFDTLDQADPLSRGGHYRAHLGDRETEFKIDRYAGLTTVPALERLVRF